MWRERKLRKLLNLIDHLPRDSALSEAMAQDPELAAREEGRERTARKPRISEWSPLVDVMARAADELAILNRNFVIANSKKGSTPPEIRFYPRPVTAFDRRRQAAVNVGYEFLRQRTEERQRREAEQLARGGA